MPERARCGHEVGVSVHTSARGSLGEWVELSVSVLFGRVETSVPATHLQVAHQLLLVRRAIREMGEGLGDHLGGAVGFAPSQIVCAGVIIHG